MCPRYMKNGISPLSSGFFLWRKLHEFQIFISVSLEATVVWISLLHRFYSWRTTGDLVGIVHTRNACWRRRIHNGSIYPPHEFDPRFGISGSLSWTLWQFPVTLADALFPDLDRIWSQHIL